MQRSDRPVSGREWKTWQLGWWLLAGAGLAAFLLAPGLLPDKLMALAAGVCPQRAGHSYFLAGLQLPLEARMLGIFGGFLGTALYVWLGGLALQLPGRARFAVLMGLVALTVADGLNATAYDFALGALYRPDNAVRLATGLLAGVATALVVMARFWVCALPSMTARCATRAPAPTSTALPPAWSRCFRTLAA